MVDQKVENTTHQDDHQLRRLIFLKEVDRDRVALFHPGVIADAIHADPFRLDRTVRRGERHEGAFDSVKNGSEVPDSPV